MSGVEDSGKDPVIAAVSINLPIWVHKYRAAEREARASYRAALRAEADRQNELGARARLVLYQLRDAERRIKLYRDALLPKAHESLRASTAAFRGGTAGFTDLIDTQRTLLEFALALERARADHAQRAAEVEMLLGRPLRVADKQQADTAKEAQR